MFAWQLFRGQYHLLRAGICHRDIKPQNLLIDEETGLLKIGDFGSSTFEPKKCPQPSYHVTRYYRPPELLLGAKIYGCEVGISLQLYIDCFGMPTDNDAFAMNASKSKWKDLKTVLPTSKDCPSEAMTILEQMLVYIPTQRLHGPQLLCDPFFKELFDKKTKRPSGKPIGCLSSADVKEVLSGDVSMTGSIQSTIQ
ncbi:hypothetical protein ANCCAN_04939 [Ancylostoma caninum]|uniref:Protein kinase domain-containing protein n=1 Tax=Ancylostoma caninum TaxID=29170 RepID=A0A368H157_ANCCA|nr:hypothetical protein ANCCAN_04939 [Ancylostoma caninum]